MFSTGLQTVGLKVGKTAKPTGNEDRAPAGMRKKWQQHYAHGKWIQLGKFFCQVKSRVGDTLHYCHFHIVKGCNLALITPCTEYYSYMTKGPSCGHHTRAIFFLRTRLCSTCIDFELPDSTSLTTGLARIWLNRRLQWNHAQRTMASQVILGYIFKCSSNHSSRLCHPRCLADCLCLVLGDVCALVTALLSIGAQ